MEAPQSRRGARIQPLPLLLAATVLGIVSSLVLRISPLVLYAGASSFALVALGWRAARRVETLLPAMALVAAARGVSSTAAAPCDIRHAVGARVVITGTAIASVGADRGARVLLAAETVEKPTRGPQPCRGTVWAILHGSTPPPQGARLRLRGELFAPLPATNPGGFDFRAYMARQGIHCTLLVRRGVDNVRLAPPETLDRLVGAVRDAVAHAADRRLPASSAALAKGLLLSARGDLPVTVEEAFRATGTVHILSASGLHVSALGWAVGAAMGLLGASLAARRLAALASIWGFALVVGGGAPVVRSALMATLALGAPFVRRDADPLHGLMVAALGLLLVAPLTLFDPGAQLSFATVATLLGGMPVVERWGWPCEPGGSALARALRWLGLALAVGVLAQLGSAPLVAYHFSLVSWIAPVANVPIAALSEAGLLMVALAVLVDAVPGLGGLAWGIAHPILGGLLWLARVFAAVPGASSSIAPPPVMALALYYAILMGGGAYARAKALESCLFVPAGPAGAGGGLSSDTGEPACDVSGRWAGGRHGD